MCITFQIADTNSNYLGKTISKKQILRIIEEEGFVCGDICIIYCSDEYLLEINRKYLEKDYYTDVITFDYGLKKTMSGDIFISTDRIEENSQIYGEDRHAEMNRVIVHGILHLAGYQDATSEQKIIMTQKENYYLERFS